MDPERWRLGERDESTSFQNKYNVFHPVDRSEANVDKAYLHGTLEEELYMRVPEGIDSSKYASKVLKLDHALNGFKQAGHDLLFVSPDLNEIQRIKGDLKSEYGIMDLGEARSR
ncbi:hypothetical protein B0A53_06451 [Rhodotorula sp. CCFEE 5036]|nr:hypothetical protein B0A53_06451 [Rhodotorula sp. CCFEE 5036]